MIALLRVINQDGIIDILDVLNIVDLLNAERNFFSAQRDFNSSKYDFIIAELNLKLSAGVLSPSDIYDISNYMNN